MIVAIVDIVVFVVVRRFVVFVDFDVFFAVCQQRRSYHCLSPFIVVAVVICQQHRRYHRLLPFVVVAVGVNFSLSESLRSFF